MNPDSELVSLIDTALGLPISESSWPICARTTTHTKTVFWR